MDTVSRSDPRRLEKIIIMSWNNYGKRREPEGNPKEILIFGLARSIMISLVKHPKEM